MGTRTCTAVGGTVLLGVTKLDFLETGLCACEAIGLDPDGHHDHIKRPQPSPSGPWGAPDRRRGAAPKPGPAYAGFRLARADAVASRGPTRPQMAAARAGSPAKLWGFKIYLFENRVLENRENGLHAEFNSGCNPFVRILIPATQFERRICFKINLGYFSYSQKDSTAVRRYGRTRTRTCT